MNQIGGSHNVIDFMCNKKTKIAIEMFKEKTGQKNVKHKGASMRLGSYNCKLKNNTLVKSAYQKTTINERHRHRYEVNNKYIPILEKNGLIISGKNPKLNLVEIVEYKKAREVSEKQEGRHYRGTGRSPKKATNRL